MRTGSTSFGACEVQCWRWFSGNNIPVAEAPLGKNASRERQQVIRKEAWLFCRTSSGVRLCWELEEPKGYEPSLGRGRLAAAAKMEELMDGNFKMDEISAEKRAVMYIQARPKPGTRDSNPKSRNPKLETRSPNFESRIPRLETMKPPSKIALQSKTVLNTARVVNNKP